MIGKTLFVLVVVVGLMVPFGAWADSAPPATVSILCHVDSYAEWASTTANIGSGDWDFGTIGSTNQTRIASVPLTLYTNVNTTLTPAPGTNNGVLTNGTALLDTQYKITGATGAAGYLDAGTDGTGAFFTANTYAVTHSAGTGSYTITLWVKAIAPTNAAPDAGDYTCDLTLTASW